MAAIVKVKNSEGNWVAATAFRGAKGDTGDSGVYVGTSDTWGTGKNVRVNPSGSTLSVYTTSEVDSLLASRQIENVLVDSVSTSITVALASNTTYTYGTLSSLSISFPSSPASGASQNAYFPIHVMWESGETATNLTVDATNALTVSFTPATNKICELDAIWNAVKSKWVVKFSQQPNTNPTSE